MVIATGFFDGVHLGHRFILRQLVEESARRGDESMVVTFWPHPRNVLHREEGNLHLLTSLDEKKALIEEIGVNHIEVVPFSRDFSGYTTEEYLREYIIGRFGGKAILLGYDNRIGSDQCFPDKTADIAERLGLDVIRPEYVSSGETAISSTRIRIALEAGDVVSANAMLGYGYKLQGTVVDGNKIGRTIGFPTANMSLDEPMKLIPDNGVYLVKVEVLGKTWNGMCNIGVRPTVGAGNALTIETNIFGFDADIYGRSIAIEFVRKIREEVKFNNFAMLAKQLEEDRARCLGLL